MRVIELNAANWRDELDYYNALKLALGSPPEHGSSVDAWVDSILYGSTNCIEPPYLLRLVGTSKCPTELRRRIDELAEVIGEAREWKRRHYGADTEVAFDINP